MNSGWAAFLGVIAGSVISGGLLLLADWLRHRRRRKETTQDRLLEQRLLAYAELAKRLTELRWELPLVQYGVEPLRWPKDRRISPQFFDQTSGALDQEKSLARTTHERLDSLKEFALAQALILAPDVQIAFWEAFGEFWAWRTKVRLTTDLQLEQLCGDHESRIEDALTHLCECPLEAMFEDLGVSGFGFAGSEGVRRARERGRARVKAVLKKEE